ncbi:lppM domain protein [Mycobacteroides abscessus MAB_091912_2446]|uniref:LppM domain protein n=1 Tax=Mycobacteroides abscessus MAB_091912_2446 TaxID=1335414 RepID=A0A829M911_9MYCO|nr:lppM domain protein [Mycobacteroides abscessus MAB_091912_2446]
MLGSDSVQWKLNPGVVSSFTRHPARYTDPSTRSFNGAAIFVSIAALLVGALVASMAWLDRDQSRGLPRAVPGVTLTPRFSNTSEVARAKLRVMKCRHGTPSAQ